VQLGLGDPSKPTTGILVVSPLSDPKDVKIRYSRRVAFTIMTTALR